MARRRRPKRDGAHEERAAEAYLGYVGGRTHRLSPERAGRLRRALDRLERTAPPRRRLPLDPVSLPHRYRDPRDVEVAGLLAASLAYGRADLFLPKVTRVLESMGPCARRLRARARRHRGAGAPRRLRLPVQRRGGRGGAAPRHGTDARAAGLAGGGVPRRGPGGGGASSTRRSAGSSASSATWISRRWSGRWGSPAGWTTCCRCRSARARRSGCTSISGGWCAAGWGRPRRVEAGAGEHAPRSPGYPRGAAGLAPGPRAAADDGLGGGGGHHGEPPGHRSGGPGPLRLRALPPRDERRVSAARPGRAVRPVRAAAGVQRGEATRASAPERGELEPARS